MLLIESVMKFAQPAAASRLVGVVSSTCIRYNRALNAMVITDANTTLFSTYCNARVRKSGKLTDVLYVHATQ